MNYSIPLPTFKTRAGLRIKPMPVRIVCSSNLTWKELRPLVRFAVAYTARESARYHPERLMRCQFSLQFKHTKKNWHGWAWNRKANIYIGRRNVEPHLNVYRSFKDMPEFWINDWQELCVALTAHEFWHLVGPGYSGKEAEHDCEIVASDCLDAWRKFQGRTFTPPPALKINEIVSSPGPDLVLASV